MKRASNEPAQTTKKVKGGAQKTRERRAKELKQSAEHMKSLKSFFNSGQCETEQTTSSTNPGIHYYYY